MRDSALEAQGFAFYVEKLRKGSVEPYFAYRVYEKSWRVPRESQRLVREATIRLLEADPWFLATAMPYLLNALRTKDLHRLTPFVGAGQPGHASAMLRATLWFHARKGAHHPDRPGRDQLRRALSFLQKVPRRHRSQAWHEMVVGCYRVLDYDRYKRAFPLLHEKTSPEWRAAGLSHFLDELGARGDWSAYDRFRGEWERLPRGHHACQCYVNALHTNDGLRAVAAGEWSRAGGSLTKAAAVHGCPHLNSGGLRLDLARRLLAKKTQLDAVRGYLEHAAGFGGNEKDVESLQRRLGRLTTQTRARDA